MVIGKLAVMREMASTGAVYALVILTVVLLASVAGSVNQFKPPLVIAGTMLFPFHVTGWTLYAFVILLGVISGATPTATFAAPEVMGNPHLSGIGMAVVSLGMNLGIVLGPLLFGQLVQTLGWVNAGYWLIPISLFGFIASWLVRVR